jgi:hypothetical protein
MPRELVAEVEDIRKLAHELARLRALAGDAPYPDSEYGMRLTDEGVVFFHNHPREWEEGYEVSEIAPITWGEIEASGAATERYKARIEKKKRDEAVAQDARKREQFVRLANELGVKLP